MSRDGEHRNRTAALRCAPWGVVGMLVLVFLIESSLSSRIDLLSDTTATNWRFSAKAARKEARSVEVLGLGTSLLKFGLIPRKLASDAGKSAYNLATCSSSIPTSYFLLRRALEAGAHPSAIVLDCQEAPVRTSDLGKTFETIRVNRRNWPELLTVRDAIDLAWSARDLDFLTDLSLARLLPSYRTRHEIQNTVLATLNEKPLDQTFHALASRRNWRVNEGVHLMPTSADANKATVAPQRTGNVRKVEETGWSRNRLTEIYQERLLNLAASRGIRVFWVIPPITTREQNGRDANGLGDHLTRVAARAQALDPTVVVIDGRDARYPDSAFFDSAHLNAGGAATFSTDLAAIIGRSLRQPPREKEWVSLPPFRTIEEVPPFEDLGQSMLALKNAERGLRK